MIEQILFTELHAASLGGFTGTADAGTWAFKIAQIIFADIILSGDNALVIGMAAAGLPPGQRRQAIVGGIALAALFRILFAVIAATLLDIPGILFLGGLLLAWVCWRFYKDLRHFNSAQSEQVEAAAALAAGTGNPLFRALSTIAIADVSMSLDNVIAVAAIAREDTAMLFFGLSLAIVLMAFCATIIMKILNRYPFLSWAGLVFLVYLTATLLIDGAADFPILLRMI